MVKNLPASSGEAGSIPGLERSLGQGNGNPLQYSCLENPMDRGTWQATAHGGRKESIATEKHTSQIYQLRRDQGGRIENHLGFFCSPFWFFYRQVPSIVF